jgi:HlyD family secretion protein
MTNSSYSDSLSHINSDEFLPSVGRWSSLSGLILVGTIGVAVGLSSVMKYNVAVKANAVIRPAGELRVVHAEMEGTIRQIEVKENQRVRQGEVIAYLDDTKLQIQKSQLQSSIQQNQLQLTQLDTQVRLINSQSLAESHVIDRAVVAARAEVSRNQSEYTEKSRSAQADFEEAQVALELATSEFDRYAQLAAQGAISQQQFVEKQSAVRTAEARLARSQALLAPSSASIDIAKEEIAQQRSRGSATLANLNREREALVQRRAEVQTQLIRDQKELEQLEQDLERNIIRSTNDGIVFRLNLLNPSQVVRTGDTVAQIAPLDAPLVIKANVANQHVDKVALGQSVSLRIEACPYTDYGTLKGRVTEISPDTSSTQSSASENSNTTQGTNNNSTYAVTIEPERSHFGSSQRQCRLQSGMEASASIISRQETFLQFVLRKLRLLTDL